MVRKATYRDINLAFDRHPLTGDVVTATDIEAIKKSLRNLIMTNLYDVPFSPNKGTSLNAALFENFTPITSQFLRTKINEMVDTYETRIQIQRVVVLQKEDSHTLEVTINFKVLDLNRFEEITVFVERTR